ncbi:MAG TPA: hydroxymethylbilane synthase [Gemmatimonadales bacterium]|nr:hydroxymethylbilane synthase [Gemmatimonadales bacterium]
MSGLGAPLRIGTRSSALAVWQTEHVRTLLRSAGYETERVEIKTTGDLTPDIPLARIGSRALFTKQIDDALLEKRIDLAVHSLKDLPTELPDGIVVSAISRREDARDALVGKGALRWTEIPEGAVIATSSLRRRAQLLRDRRDLQIVDVRGNVGTRLRKLDESQDWTAIVLAVAGLVRLGLGHRIGDRLSTDIMLPAPGQGALAVTTRADDHGIGEAVRKTVHDRNTGVAVAAERAFLRQLEGGCQVPIAAFAEQQGRGGLCLLGRVISLGGETTVEGSVTEPVRDEAAADRLGSALAEDLLAKGAAVVLREVRAAVIPAVTEP